MNTLSDRSNVDHLRKQAKDLLRLYRAGDPAGLERLRQHLPAARGKSDVALQGLQFRLHDVQSCIAREHGFSSWSELKSAVEMRRARGQDLRQHRLHWLRMVYGSDLTGEMGRHRPDLAARMLEEAPQLVGHDPWLACAVGDAVAVTRAIDANAAWVNEVGGEIAIPPLIAVTHSSLAARPRYRDGILGCLRLLLARGADPNSFCFSRRPPHTLEKPGDEQLTAIYGAAGKLHDLEMTRLLLAAGADGNDNESLYHSIDDPNPSLPCTRALLEAGTRVLGTNALAKVLDFDNLGGLKMLLAHTKTGDAQLNHALHWAIYRGRSAAHVKALIDAGADPKSLDAHRQDVHHNAANFALPEVLRILGGDTRGTLTDEERFVAACARADENEARRLLTPDVFARLTPAQLKQLPHLAMSGRDAAVRLMVQLGWPIGTRGGDIDGSALNWAVFRGRPELTEFLLAHGATFREPHGYGSDVLGTLAWASLNQPRVDGDWPGCAAAMLRHGLPKATLLPDVRQAKFHRAVRIDGRDVVFPEEVAEVLLAGND